MGSEQLFEDKAHLDQWITDNSSLIVNPKKSDTSLTFELEGHTEETPNLCEGTITQVDDDYDNTPKTETKK